MRRVRRAIALLAVLAMALSLAPLAMGQEVLFYDVRDDGVWITGSNVRGALDIPAQLEGLPVVGIAERAFVGNGSVTAVTLPESLRYIEPYAFADCDGITGTVAIPDGVAWIAPNAMGTLRYSGKRFSAADRCNLLSSRHGFVPEGALEGRTSLRIGGMVFWIRDGQAELVDAGIEFGGTLVLPERVDGAVLTAIGPWSFCSARRNVDTPVITDAVVPGTVSTVGDYAFYDSGVRSVFLSEGVRHVGTRALYLGFQGGTVTMPASVQSFGGSVFTPKDGLQRMEVYAYADSPAARQAAAEYCGPVPRDGADGRRYGVWGGMRFYEEDGCVSLTGGRLTPPFRVGGECALPAEIDGFPVTAFAAEVLDQVLMSDCYPVIPPTVRRISGVLHTQAHGYPILVWPGSDAEAYCRRNGISCQSVFTHRGVPFTDTREGLWYHESVCFCYHTGLMNGTGDTTFSPNGDTSRAMLATVLWRMAGAPEPETHSPFADVPPDSWYGAAVAWAYDSGISNGVSETAFAPDAPVTREQIAAMLLRFARGQGMAADGQGEIQFYPDADQVSDWAVEAMQWARAAGILKGRLRDGDVYLDPRAKARRCEIAEMLMRFCLSRQ